MDNKLIFGTLALVGSIGLVSYLFGVGVDSDATETSAADSRSAAIERAQRARNVGEIVYARRFTVRAPFRHLWRADRPLVHSGWLIVVAASTEKLQPRQVQEPVLYVGEQTADRVNTGRDSGKVVCIVPGALDLTASPVFFGDPALPERLLPRQIGAELERARRLGYPTISSQELADLEVGDVLRVADELELRLAAMDLVSTWSPQEQDLVDGWRLPRHDGK